MSFVMLTESQIVPPQSLVDDRVEISREARDHKTPKDQTWSDDQPEFLSQQVNSADRLFEILSSRSDIDHPVCSECTELLLTSLQDRLSASTKERDVYISFLKSLQASHPTITEVSAAQASLDSSKSAESKAFAELLALEREREQLDDEIADLEAESLKLHAEEQAFWRSRNAFSATLSSFQNERDAIEAAYQHDAQQLDKLQRSNVYNDTFSIGHDGHFGTINNLRLGRLPPPHNVEWSEINAAWGSAALLLVTVADKLDFTFHGYRIVPMGSTSTIERLDYQSPLASTTSHTRSSLGNTSRDAPAKVTSLDLFSSGDLPLGRMLLHRRIDAGMVAFIECLRQLGDFVEMGLGQSAPTRHHSDTSTPKSRDAPVQSPGMGLPYAIRKDRIGDTSIKLSVSDDESWTRACKFALTCCKYVLAHASNIDGPERPERKAGRV